MNKKMAQQIKGADAPLVSVLVLTYNQQDYIAETLDSIVSQKINFPVEVLVGEDCSTDNTRTILRQYEQNHPCVRGIYQSKNMGLIKNYDSVMRQCRGKYIAVCGGDDYWTDAAKLQKQVDFLEKHPDYGLVYCEIDRLHQDTGVVERSFFKNKAPDVGNTFEYFLIHAPFLAPCTWLMRTALLEPFGEREKNYVAEDLHLLLLLSSKAKVWFMEESMAMYRILSSSASHLSKAIHLRSFQKNILEIQIDWTHRKSMSSDVVQAIIAHHYSAHFMLLCLSGDNLSKVAYGYLGAAKKINWKRWLVYKCTRVAPGRGLLRKYFFITGKIPIVYDS